MAGRQGGQHATTSTCHEHDHHRHATLLRKVGPYDKTCRSGSGSGMFYIFFTNIYLYYSYLRRRTGREDGLDVKKVLG
jgi:hypothetical protein